jgi:NADH-quinone oxidoreductase subunit N
MTYLYASTGSIRLDSEVNATSGIMFTIGSVMLLGGFLFKMTSAPFHLWAPDVYEAAPAPVVAFLSVVPKLAAFTLIASWLPRYFGNDLVIVSISILTIVIGTLAALNQSNAKRMMAYSSVAQAGFLLAIVGSRGSYETALYYALVFAIMNFVVFIVIHLQEQSGGGTAFTDFTGWGYKAPLPAVMITLGLVSLVGLPPMAGFMAKLFVFTAIWTEFSMSQKPVFLALFVVGLLATAASLYFYLKIPFYAFFRGSQEKQLIKFPVFTNLLLLILVGLLLALFLAPGLLMG